MVFGNSGSKPKKGRSDGSPSYPTQGAYPTQQPVHGGQPGAAPAAGMMQGGYAPQAAPVASMAQAQAGVVAPGAYPGQQHHYPPQASAPPYMPTAGAYPPQQAAYPPQGHPQPGQHPQAAAMHYPQEKKPPQAATAPYPIATGAGAALPYPARSTPSDFPPSYDQAGAGILSTSPAAHPAAAAPQAQPAYPGYAAAPQPYPSAAAYPGSPVPQAAAPYAAQPGMPYPTAAPGQHAMQYGAQPGVQYVQQPVMQGYPGQPGVVFPGQATPVTIQTTYGNLAVGEFDANARFGGKGSGGSAVIPPCPPGVMPTRQQIAAANGGAVEVRQKTKSFF